jgi:hypothetical protein
LWVGAAAFVTLSPNKFVEVLTLLLQASALKVLLVEATMMKPKSSEMQVV